jgi:hypothetical protein
MKGKIFLFLVVILWPIHIFAQAFGYKVEAQSSVSNRTTPLWLNANHYGLSSLEKSNGYFLAGVEKKDSLMRSEKQAGVLAWNWLQPITIHLR